MKRLRKHEATGASGGNGGNDNEKKAINLRPQYTTGLSLVQASSLLDLAQFEADSALELYLTAERLAAARRRRYFKAIDNLRTLQREVFTTEAGR